LDSVSSDRLGVDIFQSNRGLPLARKKDLPGNTVFVPGDFSFSSGAMWISASLVSLAWIRKLYSRLKVRQSRDQSLNEKVVIKSSHTSCKSSSCLRAMKMVRAQALKCSSDLILEHSISLTTKGISKYSITVLLRRRRQTPSAHDLN